MACSSFQIPKCGCAGRAPLCRNLSLTSHPVTFPTLVRTGFHAAGIGPIPWGITFKVNLQILSANNILCVCRETEESINQSINQCTYLNQHPPSFISCSNDQIFTFSQSLKGSLYFNPTSDSHLWIYHHCCASITSGQV